jgi:diguanylate cyclase (GGDEF)-like protein
MAVLETLVVALALGFGAFATVGWLRLRAQLVADRLATGLIRARERASVEGVHRLGVAARRSVDDVRAEIRRAITTLVPAIDSVLIFDQEPDALRCVAAGGSRVAAFAGTAIARTDPDSLPARALACGHRVERAAGQPSFHPGDAFALAVPLAQDRGRTGVVYVAAPQPVAPGDAEALVTMIEHAGFAYALAQEREADRRDAEYDALTGLLTPRAFRRRLGALLERARFAPAARIALLFVDTDHFKTWNDTYGHAGGDALLRAIARTLRDALRGGDELAARNGGDEFCLVFVDTEKSAALDRAERMRAAIAALDAGVTPAAGSIGGVTASIGVAAYPADARTPSDLLQRADETMYHSKRTGRNAVSYYGVDGSPLRLDEATAVT